LPVAGAARYGDAMGFRALVLASLLVVALGCATPAERFATRADALGFAREVVRGDPFAHVVWQRGVPAGDLLHVYLDGDGSPMLAGVPSPDPTPREPLVLDLMALDPIASVYVGRPCYHGVRTAACRGAVWTSARYSDSVVASLVTVVRRVVQRDGARRVVWIGHSGGGALARLAAPRVPETVALVTIGANLSLGHWTTVRDMGRLDGSLDPAAAPPLPAQAYERHYVGSRDAIVPPAVVMAGAPAATVVVVEGYDHVCCWRSRWPTMLADLEARLAASPAR
jgi:hypothetical protein